MRVVAILALAAILCASASATTTAPTTQDEAKALKDTWPACSQIVHGRLGSLSPPGLTAATPYTISASATTANTTGSFQYVPCATVALSDAGMVDGKGNLLVSIVSWDGLRNFGGVYAAADAKRMASFSMPLQKNDVAKFVATLELVPTSGRGTGVPTTAVVTTSCDQTGTVASPNATYTLSADGKTINVYFTDINACARFPYTNEKMPSGAIAALIIVLACFVIQFGICGWYHKTHKEDTPFTEHNVE